MMTADSCDHPLVRTDKLDAEIIKKIRDTQIMWMENKVHESRQDSNRTAALKKEASRIEDKISRLIDLYSEDAMPLEIMKKKMDELNKKKSYIEEEIRTLDAENDRREIRQILDQLKDFDWEGAAPEEKRIMLSQAIERIEVDGETAVVTFTL